MVGEGPVNLTFGINICNAQTINTIKQKMFPVNLNVISKFDPRVDIKNGKEYLQFNKVNADFNTTK